MYNHSLSVDIEGRITEKDFNRLSALTKYNNEEFAYIFDYGVWECYDLHYDKPVRKEIPEEVEV